MDPYEGHGTWWSGDASCEDCEPYTGPCCDVYGEGNCQENMTWEECYEAYGIWLGPWANDCGDCPAIGACCYEASGYCDDHVLSYDCSNGGVFLGDGTTRSNAKDVDWNSGTYGISVFFGPEKGSWDLYEVLAIVWDGANRVASAFTWTFANEVACPFEDWDRVTIQVRNDTGGALRLEGTELEIDRTGSGYFEIVSVGDLWDPARDGRGELWTLIDEPVVFASVTGDLVIEDFIGNEEMQVEILIGCSL